MVQDDTRPAQKVLDQGGECACGPCFGFLTSGQMLLADWRMTSFEGSRDKRILRAPSSSFKHDEQIGKR
jgi:hypothetical protein